MQQLPLFIHGEWISGGGRATEPVFDPSTGRPFALLTHATKDDLDQALDSARRAYEGWRRMSAMARGEILRRAAGLLRARSAELAADLSREQGKTVREAAIEINVSAEVFEWAADEGRRIYGRVIPSREPGWRQTVLKEPIGVVAAFTPWNFPAMIPARKIASALSAGCACIIKPSEEVPATAIALAKALQDAGLPAGVLNVVFGVPADVSSHLIASPIVRKVSFTGSTGVGRHIAALAAAGPKPATLELGGHAPVIVCEDVDVERVAQLCAANKFRNAGQVCISPTRFMVHESIHDRFVEAMGKATQAMAVGPGHDPASHMGPLASERRVAAIGGLVDDAVSAGARLVSGGAAGTGEGFFFSPTVLCDIPARSRVLTEEPFGPLALVSRFSTLDDAIAQANSLPYGLAAYAFTNDADDVLRLSNGIETGMLGINTFFIAGCETPFGGVKDSGYGYEGGTEGTEAYLVSKYVAQAPSVS